MAKTSPEKEIFAVLSSSVHFSMCVLVYMSPCLAPLSYVLGFSPVLLLLAALPPRFPLYHFADVPSFSSPLSPPLSAFSVAFAPFVSAIRVFWAVFITSFFHKGAEDRKKVREGSRCLPVCLRPPPSPYLTFVVFFSYSFFFPFRPFSALHPDFFISFCCCCLALCVCIDISIVFPFSPNSVVFFSFLLRSITATFAFRSSRASCLTSLAFHTPPSPFFAPQKKKAKK